MSYESDREDRAVYFNCLRPDEEPDEPWIDDACKALEKAGYLEPEPLTDALDPLQTALADTHRMQERLRATNDSRVLQRSNELTKLLLDILGAHR